MNPLNSVKTPVLPKVRVHLDTWRVSFYMMTIKQTVAQQWSEWRLSCCGCRFSRVRRLSRQGNKNAFCQRTRVSSFKINTYWESNKNHCRIPPRPNSLLPLYSCTPVHMYLNMQIVKQIENVPTKKCFPKTMTEMSVGRNSPLPGRDSAYSSELVICSAYLHALNAHLVGGSSQ